MSLKPIKYWLQGKPIHVFHNAVAIGNQYDMVKAFNALSQDEINSITQKTAIDFVTKLRNTPIGMLPQTCALEIRQKLQKFPEIDPIIISCLDKMRIEHVLQKTRDFNPSVDLNNEKLKLLARHRLEAAQQLFDKLQPSRKYRETMCESYGLAGQLEKALGFVDEESDTFNLSLLKASALSGQITLSNKYFAKIKDNETLKTAFEYLLLVYGQRGLPGDAHRVYKSMRSKGFEVSSFGLEQLIRSVAIDKNVAAANRWFYKKYRVPGFSPSPGMFTALIEVYMSIDDEITAYKLLKKICKHFNDAIGVDKLVHLPNGLITPFYLNAKGKRLDYVLDRLQHVKFADEAKNGVLTKLVQVSEPLQALEFYNAINGYTPYEAHVAAIRAFVELNKLDEAQKIFESTIEHAFGNENGYLELIKGYAKGKNKERVSELSKDITKNVDLYEAMLEAGISISADELYEQYIVPAKHHVHIEKTLVDAGLGLVKQ